MKCFLLITLFFLSVVSDIQSQTITVKQDGTGDYITIQEGVNASVDGDTVLVYPGVYYENVEYNSKNIILASLNILNNDPYYISHTIIDGNQNGSCVKIENCEQITVLYGFTIQNGTGSYSGFEVMYSGGLTDVLIETSDRQMYLPMKYYLIYYLQSG